MDKNILVLYVLWGALAAVVIWYIVDGADTGFDGVVNHVTNKPLDLNNPPGSIDGRKLAYTEVVLVSGGETSAGLYKHNGKRLVKLRKGVHAGRVIFAGDKLYQVEKSGTNITVRDIMSTINIDTSGTVRARSITDGQSTISNGIVSARRFDDGIGYMERGELH